MSKTWTSRMVLGSSQNTGEGMSESRLGWQQDDSWKNTVLEAVNPGEPPLPRIIQVPDDSAPVQASLGYTADSSSNYLDFELPPPTQKPRPAFSRLAITPANDPATAAGPSRSSAPLRPSRKRPCRGHYSLPSAGVSRSSHATGSSSAPASNQMTDEQIEALLAELEIPSSLRSPAPSTTRKLTPYKRIDGQRASPSRSVLQPTPVNLESPILHRHRRAKHLGLSKSPVKSGEPKTAFTVSAPPSESCQANRTLASPPKRLRTHPGSSKTPAGPRLGMRPGPSRALKPFRSPLPAVPTSQTLPCRGTRSDGRSLAVISLNPATEHLNKSGSSKRQAGSSDGPGDDSFDSIDGLLQEGGPEIDELLRTVDGPP